MEIYKGINNRGIYHISPCSTALCFVDLVPDNSYIFLYMFRFLFLTPHPLLIFPFSYSFSFPFSYCYSFSFSFSFSFPIDFTLVLNCFIMFFFPNSPSVSVRFLSLSFS